MSTLNHVNFMWCILFQSIIVAGIISKMMAKITVSIKLTTPSEEKDILVCIITAIQLSCNYKGTWLDRTSQG